MVALRPKHGLNLDIRDVQAASERIRPHIHHTPVVTSSRLDAESGARLFFKCENLQKAGAFKSRGACNAVYQLPPEVAARGVITHSSGNHGAALARAAQLRGIGATIVVPTNANPVKKAAIESYGALIVECEPTLEARESGVAKIVEETGAHLVPPYDDDRIIAGQGTAALEMVRDIKDGLDLLLVPVGGGGLLAGTSLVGADRGLAVFGAEPEGADDAYRSLATGIRVTEQVPKTVADGLRTTLGQRNFEIIQMLVSGILRVSDLETVAAMKRLWTRLKLVVEPSSAVTYAAITRYPEVFQGRRVGVVLSGGNIDPDDLPFNALS